MAVLVLAAACGGAAAGVHPTGTVAIDDLYGAGFAALVTLSASRASRWTLLFLAAVGFAFSRYWLWIPAGAGLVAAFGVCVPKRRSPVFCALAGALAAQVVLRWPSVGFHGLTAVAALVAVAPALLSAWRNSGRRVHRICGWAIGVLLAVLVVFAVPVVVSMLSARSGLESGVSLAKSSVNSFEDGRSDAAKAVIGRAAGDLGHAHRTLSGWWNIGGYVVPVLAQQERALADGATAGARLTSVVDRQADALDLSNLRFRDGRIDVQSLEALQKPTVLVDQAVISAQHEMAKTRSAWLISPIETRLSSFDSQMTRFRSDADLAVLAVRDGPALLGADGVRHYFVAFMSPAETRGLGGILGAYGILTVDDGSLKLTQSGRPIDLTAADSPAWHLDGPASFLARYGQFKPQDSFEDLSLAPDLPTVGDVIEQLYPQVGGTHLDGVIVLDPYALGDLLDLTGPVQVPGLGELTAQNAGPVLLKRQYLIGSITTDQRHDYLQDALAAGFHQLTTSSLPSPETIASALGPAVRQGRLLFWSSHPADDPLLDRLDLTGAFPSRGDGDLLAVTDANGAADKIDAYLDQSISDQVSYDPATGQVASTVTVALDNTAPASGLPEYVIGSYTGSGLPSGTSKTWLSLYSPLALTSVTVDGKPVTFSGPTEEDGVYAYSGFVVTPPSSTVKVVAKLAGRVAPGGYTMTTRLQPLANPQSFTVSVAPAGPSFAGGTWTAGTDQVQRHTWALSRRKH